VSHLIRQFVSFTLKTGWIYFVSNRDILALITTVIKKMYSGERINGKQVSVLCGILKCTCGFFFSAAQRRLEELQNAIGKAEQQVLEVTGELQQLEGALAQKKVRKRVTMWIAGESV